MKLLTTTLIAITLVISVFPNARAEQSATPDTDQNFKFSHFLKERPLDLDQLLGKHISAVAPGTAWESLSIPEEYKNATIRYEVFAREDLRGYMKSWDFLTGEYCVSKYSMFLLFFNRGFVFKVELRFMPDSYAGKVRSDDPGYCADEAPIFLMIAKKLGGTIVSRDNSEELVRFTDKSIMVLGTGGGITDLSWTLRGSPGSPAF
ncbi:hypothetical protein ACVWXO_001860 [Bradyrhizobium sp. LM2.7]